MEVSMSMFSSVLIALVAASASGQAGPEPCAPSGINLTGLSSWTTSWPFVDSFKIRRPWISGTTDGTVWDDAGPFRWTLTGG